MATATKKAMIAALSLTGIFGVVNLYQGGQAKTEDIKCDHFKRGTLALLVFAAGSTYGMLAPRKKDGDMPQP